jgi:hypothetical protein
MSICSVFVFCECVADNDKFTCGTVGKVFEYDIEELKLLFNDDPTLFMFTDCLKYLLLPKLTEAENLELAAALASWL